MFHMVILSEWRTIFFNFELEYLLNGCELEGHIFRVGWFECKGHDWKRSSVSERAKALRGKEAVYWEYAILEAMNFFMGFLAMELAKETQLY